MRASVSRVFVGLVAIVAGSFAVAPQAAMAAPGDARDVQSKPVVVLKVKPGQPAPSSAPGQAATAPAGLAPSGFEASRGDVMPTIGARKTSIKPAARAKNPSPPAEPPEPDFASADQLLGWINGYRETPEPRRLPRAVAAMSKFGLLRDMDSAGLYVGFTAGVLGSNPAIAEELVTKMFPRPPEEQGLIIKAIAYSGLADWRDILTKFVERMPARRKQIDILIFGKAETLETVALDTGPAPIDSLWGNYFATGSFQPIERILSTLAWANDKNIDKLTIAGMAKWTLASNAMRDKALLDKLREAGAGKPKEVAVPLREIVVAAESFEIGKIRKDALAAIDDARRRGPEPKRTTWSTAVGAAPTVIGLACVAASVAGQVALGIPCVVSGALSSAVAKHWGQGP